MASMPARRRPPFNRRKAIVLVLSFSQPKLRQSFAGLPTACAAPETPPHPDQVYRYIGFYFGEQVRFVKTKPTFDANYFIVLLRQKVVNRSEETVHGLVQFSGSRQSIRDVCGRSVSFRQWRTRGGGGHRRVNQFGC
jgi:hypothetical protein